MPQIKVSCTVHPQHANYQQMRDTWLRIEELGADALWTWDHFFPLYGDPEGLHFEGYTLLAAMAEVTSTIPFGMLVTCNSYRNPNLLADMARTVDHISGGRHILGIGAGWFERDYEEYGYEFGTAADRLRALDRNMPIIRQRLANLNPPPVDGKIPIMIGGSGPKVTLRIAAQHADMWNAAGTPEEYAQKVRTLNDWCEKVGRDPAEIERTANCPTPEVLDLADAYIDAGASHLIIPARGPEYDLSVLEQLIAWRDRRRAA
jgi:probable F420-dependent oxidoreductase